MQVKVLNILFLFEGNRLKLTLNLLLKFIFVNYRQLKPPQGILGGIGRRVSSLLWSGIGTGTGTDSVRTDTLAKVTI